MLWSPEIEEHFYGTLRFNLKPPPKTKNKEVVQALVRVTRLLEGGSTLRFRVAYKWILSGDKEADNSWINYGAVAFCEGNDRQPGPPDVPQKLSLPPVHSLAANRVWQPADGPE